MKPKKNGFNLYSKKKDIVKGNHLKFEYNNKY